MMQQCYIRCQDYYLFSSLYVPDHYRKAVILLQGYSHAMTDIDYFMSNVKTELIKEGAIVLQFDPFGHGDSDGDFHEFDIKILKTNLNTVFQWLKKQYDVDVVLFTRGLFELVMRDAGISTRFTQLVALNPVILTPDEFYRLNRYTLREQTTQDFANWYNGIDNGDKEWFENFYYICGAKLKNIRGQLINPFILNQILCQLKEAPSLREKMQFILSNSKECLVGPTIPSNYSISWFEKYGALPRDPDWHFRIIKKVAELCLND